MSTVSFVGDFVEISANGEVSFNTTSEAEPIPQPPTPHSPKKENGRDDKSDAGTGDKLDDKREDKPNEEKTFTDDNIDDEGFTDEQIAQMVAQMEEIAESNKKSKTPSVADVYMSQMKGEKGDSLKYFDLIDEYGLNSTSSVPDKTNFGYSLSSAYPSTYSSTYTSMHSSPHPSTNGYKKYSHKSDFDVYADSDSEIAKNIEETVDAMNDKIDLIYDGVKEVTQIASDITERQVALTDEFEDVRDIIKASGTRLFQIEKDIKDIKETQKMILEQLDKMNKLLMSWDKISSF